MPQAMITPQPRWGSDGRLPRSPTFHRFAEYVYANRKAAFQVRCRLMTPVVPLNALADGQMLACRVESVDVLLCRVDGRYYALANHCSHARQNLHTGRLRGHEIVCPLHGARFDIRDGRCLGAPATVPVQTFRVQIEGGKVNVSVGRSP